MHILICDDDIAYTEQCKNNVMALSQKHNVEITVETAVSGKQLLFFLETKYAKVDLIYLDQNMPDLNGMETAAALRQKNVTADIVFYTVDPSKAIDAFDVMAFHYIVKGQTTDEKFEEIFVRAVQRCSQRNVEVVSLYCAGERRNIRVPDILFFEVQNRIVTVHYMESDREQSFEFYSSLSKIEETMYGSGFVRIHNAYLVADKFINKKTSTQVFMNNGSTLPVGRSYRDLVRKSKIE